MLDLTLVTDWNGRRVQLDLARVERATHRGALVLTLDNGDTLTLADAEAERVAGLLDAREERRKAVSG